MFQRTALALFLVSLFSCGKYSPAKSPDLLKPKPPKIIEIAELKPDRISLSLELPAESVGGYQLESKPSLVCLFQEDSGSSHSESASTVEGATLKAVCPLKENFVGSLRMLAEANNLKGPSSAETVFIYNRKNQPEAYISTK